MNTKLIITTIFVFSLIGTASTSHAQKLKKGKVKWADFTSVINEAASSDKMEGGVWSTEEKKFLTSDEFLNALSTRNIILVGGESGWKPGPMRAWLLENLVQRNGNYALVNGSISEKDLPKINKAQKELKGKMLNFTRHYNKKNKTEKLSSRASFQQPLLQVRADYDLPLFAGYYPQFDMKMASKQVSAQVIIAEAKRLDENFCYKIEKSKLINQSAANVSFGVFYKDRLANYQVESERVFISEGFGSVRKDIGLPDLMPSKATDMISVGILSSYQSDIDTKTLNVPDPFSSSASLSGDPKYDYIWVSSIKPGGKAKVNKNCERLERAGYKDTHAPHIFTVQDILSYQNNPVN